MKVAEIIKALSAYPSDLEVIAIGGHDEDWPCEASLTEGYARFTSGVPTIVSDAKDPEATRVLIVR